MQRIAAGAPCLLLLTPFHDAVAEGESRVKHLPTCGAEHEPTSEATPSPFREREFDADDTKRKLYSHRQCHTPNRHYVEGRGQYIHGANN